MKDAAGFVSWNSAGDIRFWSPSREMGKSLVSMHKSAVTGVLELDGGAKFLSWGDDNTLRLWSRGNALYGVYLIAPNSIENPQDHGREFTHNIWISPSGPVTHVEHFGLDDHYLVIFGDEVGVVHLPKTYE